VAALLPHVNGAARLAQDAPQSAVKPLRPRTRGLQAGWDDAGEPDAGVLDHGSGYFARANRGPVDKRVVPEQGDDLSGRQRVPPLRGRHRGRGRPQRGQPPIVGDVQLPRNGGHNGARNAQLKRHRRGTVVAVRGIPTRGARTGAGTGTDGRVAPAAAAVLWTQIALPAGVVPVASAAVGGQRGPVAAGSRMAATLARLGRPAATTVVPCIGVAAMSDISETPAVVTGGSGAATRLGRQTAARAVAGCARVVVAPRSVQATVASRAGATLSGLRTWALLGATREGRRGRTVGAPGACLPLFLPGIPETRLAHGGPRRGEGGWSSSRTRGCDSQGPGGVEPRLGRAAARHVGVTPPPCTVSGQRGHLLRRRRNGIRVGRGEVGQHRPGLGCHRQRPRRDVREPQLCQNDPKRGLRLPRDAHDANVVASLIGDGFHLMRQQRAGGMPVGVMMVR